MAQREVRSHGRLRQGADRAVRALGSWLVPSPPNASPSDLVRLHRRAGIVGGLALVIGLATTVGATAFSFTIPMVTPANADIPAVIAGAFVILVLAAFVPSATFRTSAAAWSRTLFSENDTRIRSWDRVTITFDPLLVGALLAGILTSPSVTIALIGVGLITRAAITIKRAPAHDANVRFSAIFGAFSSGVAAIIAYLVVLALAPLLIDRMSIWPLLLGVALALYSQLALNAIERWSCAISEPWAFVKDAIDPRRLLIAAITAAVAWLTFATAVAATHFLGTAAYGGEIAGLVGLGVLVVAWALLWLVSIAWWRHDARALLSAWRAHQAEVVRRLADGSLSPDLAARAALPTTTRVALATFGATRAMGVITLPDGSRRSSLAGLDRHDVGPIPHTSDLAARPHREIRLGRPDHDGTEGWVVIGSWLAPGAFLIRSRDIVDEYVELATLALLAPVMAQDYLSATRAFDLMFDERTRWPTMAAFHEAGQRLRDQADQSTQTTSMVVAVLEIDEFGALAGGKFEHAAVAQVVRTVLGNPDFAGEEVFVAYEGSGRIWVGLLGGPVVRQVVAQLRGLQQWLNDHGSVSSARVDVEVSVSVSLGHAAYQVDAVSIAELMTVAVDRLDRDKSARRALLGEQLGYLDFTPEDITGSAAPIAPADLARALAEPNSTAAGLELAVRPVIDTRSRTDVALVIDASWPNAPGDLDLGSPARLLDAAQHRLDLAVEYAAATLSAGRELLRETSGSTVPVLVAAPTLLFHPDAGAAAIPNLAGRLLDRVEAARTVVVVNAIPRGTGQAFALLEDRGIRVAVMASAAADTDADDLVGWSPWALIFPLDAARRPTGLDQLSVQQVTSTLARRGTHLVAEANSQAEVDALTRAGFTWVTIVPSAATASAEPVTLPISDGAN